MSPCTAQDTIHSRTDKVTTLASIGEEGDAMTLSRCTNKLTLVSIVTS